MELDQDVDFLLSEQLIQDERLLNLKEATDSINAELLTVDEELEGELYFKDIFITKTAFSCFTLLLQVYRIYRWIWISR